MAFWQVDGVALAAGGRWRLRPSREVTGGVSIDTRTLEAGAMYVAIVGERLDGHDFVGHAAEAGASAVMVQRELDEAALSGARERGVGVLVVEDTLAGLRRLAGAYRAWLGERGVKVIAVGGSNGKTTTRHLVHAALSGALRGTQSPKSFNNHIGVPVTLLGAGEADDFVVVEVGTNHPGEVAELGALVRPDGAVITSVGLEHLEHFGDVSGVAREEASLLGFVAEGGLAAVEAGAWEMIAVHGRGMAEAARSRLGMVVYGSGERVGGVEARLAGCEWLGASDASWDGRAMVHRFEVAGQGYELPLAGGHNRVNALGAIAVGRWLGVDGGSMSRQLAGVRGPAMRMAISRVGGGAGVLVINDAYNANPDSMRAALGFLRREVEPGVGGRRVAVLGDMLELGEGEASHHAGLAEAVCGGEGGVVPIVVLVGERMRHAAAALRAVGDGPAVHYFPGWVDDLPGQVGALVQPGDVVLVKGSRGMALERVVAGLVVDAGG